MTETVLVTGGSGFVATHLVETVLDHYESWHARRDKARAGDTA